jgi:outer membrane protein
VRRAGLLLALAVAGCATTDDAYDRPRGGAQSGAAAPAAGAAVPAGPLTLDDVIRIAEENRRDLAIADRRVLIAREVTGEVRAALLPAIGARGRYTARNNDPGVKFNGLELVTGERENATGQVAAIVPIYDLVAWNQLDAAKLGAEAAEHAAVRTHQDLALSVAQAYYRFLEAQKIVEVVRDSIRAIEEQVAAARDLFAQGMVAKSDVLSAEVRLGERRQDELRARGNVELAQSTLNRLIGLDIDRPTEVVDVESLTMVRDDYRKLVADALSGRPDLRAERSRIEEARAQHRAARAQFAPRLYAFGDYNYSDDDNLIHNDWLSGGVAIDIPIFNGGGNFYQMERRRKDIEQAVDAHEEHQATVRLEVKKAWIDAREAAERLPIADGGVALATENLRITRARYGQGLVTTADVLLEEERLAAARSRRFQALYAYHDALARLRNAVGQDLGR